MKMTTETAEFVLMGRRARVEFETKPAQGIGHKLTVDLQPIPSDALEYSMHGDYDGGGGQIDSSLREAAEEAKDEGVEGAADVLRLCELWDSLHLNGMSAGTRAQNTALAYKPEVKDYNARLGYLAECGLMIDRNTKPGTEYKFGSLWLYKPASPAEVEEARAILARLNGKRLNPPPAHSADDFEEPDFTNSDDIIDSRDVIKRIEYLRDFLSDLDNPTPETYDPDEDEAGDRGPAVDELAALEALESEASGYAGDWRYGAQLIRDDYFETAMDEMLEDIGDMPKDLPGYLTITVNYDALKQDYTSVEFSGVTYWVR